MFRNGESRTRRRCKFEREFEIFKRRADIHRQGLIDLRNDLNRFDSVFVCKLEGRRDQIVVRFFNGHICSIDFRNNSVYRLYKDTRIFIFRIGDRDRNCYVIIGIRDTGKSVCGLNLFDLKYVPACFRERDLVKQCSDVRIRASGRTGRYGDLNGPEIVVGNDGLDSFIHPEAAVFGNRNCSHSKDKRLILNRRLAFAHNFLHLRLPLCRFRYILVDEYRRICCFGFCSRIALLSIRFGGNKLQRLIVGNNYRVFPGRSIIYNMCICPGGLCDSELVRAVLDEVKVIKEHSAERLALLNCDRLCPGRGCGSVRRSVRNEGLHCRIRRCIHPVAAAIDYFDCGQYKRERRVMFKRFAVLAHAFGNLRSRLNRSRVLNCNLIRTHL